MRPLWTMLSAFTITILLLVSGCAGSPGVQGEHLVLRLSWWGNADRAKATEKAVREFERRYPAITVQTSFASYDSYKQKLATQAAGGNAPDVMQLDYRQISQYATSGMLLDLGTRPEVRTGEIAPGLLRTGQVSGKQYAIPMGQSTTAIAYDAEQWRRAGVPEPGYGWTWEQWADAMVKIHAATGKAGSVDPGAFEDFFEDWLRGRGKQLYSPTGGLGFAPEDLAEFWQWSSNLSRQGAVSPGRDTTQLDGSTANTPLGRGKAVSDLNWDAPSSGFSDTVKELKLAPVPVGPDGIAGQYMKPSMLAGVSANTAHPREAALLLDFLINDPVAGDILGVSRGIPPNTAIRQHIVPKLTTFSRQIADLHRTLESKLAEPPPAPPKGDNTLQTTFQRDYDHVAFGLASPLDMAREYVTEANAELKQ